MLRKILRANKIKFGTITVLLLLAICLFAKTNKYDLVFMKVPDKDAYGYQVWFCEGPDTTMFLWPDSFKWVGFFSHDSLVSIYGDTLRLSDIYPSEENGEFLQAAVIAADSSLNLSEVSFSGFYQKLDKMPPAKVTFVGTGIEP